MPPVDPLVAHSAQDHSAGLEELRGGGAPVRPSHSRRGHPALRVVPSLRRPDRRPEPGVQDGRALGGAGPPAPRGTWRRRPDRALAGEPMDEPAFAALQKGGGTSRDPRASPPRAPGGLCHGRRGAPVRHPRGVLSLLLPRGGGGGGDDGLRHGCPGGGHARPGVGPGDRLSDDQHRPGRDRGRPGRPRLLAPGLAAGGRSACGRRSEIHPTAGAVSHVAQRLLAEAEGYYASAQVGVGRLPFRSAWAVAAARGVYRDIGRLVRERGPRAWDAPGHDLTPPEARPRPPGCAGGPSRPGPIRRPLPRDPGRTLDSASSGVGRLTRQDPRHPTLTTASRCATRRGARRRRRRPPRGGGRSAR